MKPYFKENCRGILHDILPRTQEYISFWCLTQWKSQHQRNKLDTKPVHRVPWPVYKNSKTSGANSLVFSERIKKLFLGDEQGYFSVLKIVCSKTVVRELLLGVPWDAHRSTGKVYDYCRKSNVCVSIPSVNKYNWPRLRLRLHVCMVSVLACLITCTVSCDNPQ